MIFLPLDRQYVQVESQSEGHSHAMDGFIYSFKKKKKIVGTTAQAIDWRAFTQYIVVYIDMKLSVRFYFYFFENRKLSVLRDKDDAFQVST